MSLLLSISGMSLGCALRKIQTVYSRRCAAIHPIGGRATFRYRKFNSLHSSRGRDCPLVIRWQQCEEGSTLRKRESLQAEEVNFRNYGSTLAHSRGGKE